jgi:SM-20-related protein
VKDHEIRFENVTVGLAENGFAVVDDFLSVQEVNQITGLKEFTSGLAGMKKAGVGKSTGKQINESIRGDFIQWIDPAQAPGSVKLYLDRMKELMMYLNRSLFLSLKDIEAHMTVYPEGSYYKRHLDQFRADDHRKLSAICYLNNDWVDANGGQLRMYLPHGSQDVFPIAGRLVCFRSEMIEHEVLPATRPRLSLTGWFVDELRG